MSEKPSASKARKHDQLSTRPAAAKASSKPRSKENPDSAYDVEVLGQVFTPPFVVDKMFSLSKCRPSDRPWRVLEPSCGNGAFFHRIEGCTGLEIDPAHCPDGAIQKDFFDYEPEHQFDTIIGNPPYVAFKDIQQSTKSKLDMTRFDQKTNLYILFIDRCVDMLRVGGELIFITPRYFLKAKSARALNEKLMALGTFTYMEDLGDKRIFKKATPNCVIWRFVKGDMSHKTEDGQENVLIDGRISFFKDDLPFEEKYPFRVSDFFDVKVGGASGNKEVFTAPKGTVSTLVRNVVCSETIKSGQTRLMFYADDQAAPPPELLPHEAALRARGGKKLNDKNWWHWNRKQPHDTRNRVYVNTKTRRAQPFFLHDSKYYDDTILALNIKDPTTDPALLRDLLNEVDWNELGFICNGRFIFGQGSLKNAPLPAAFSALLEPAVTAAKAPETPCAETVLPDLVAASAGGDGQHVIEAGASVSVCDSTVLHPRLGTSVARHSEERLIRGHGMADDIFMQNATLKEGLGANSIDVPPVARGFLVTSGDAPFDSASKIHPEFMSLSDPARQSTTSFSASDNWLNDTDHRAIFEVEEAGYPPQAGIGSSRTMLDRVKAKLDRSPERLIPVFDTFKRRDGPWSRAGFEGHAKNNQYLCPDGHKSEKTPRIFSGTNHGPTSKGVARNRCLTRIWQARPSNLRCRLKTRFVSCTCEKEEVTSQVTRDIARTERYVILMKLWRKLERLFGPQKRTLAQRRLRIRGPCGASGEHYSAATA